MELMVLQDLINLKNKNYLEILLNGFDDNQSFKVETQTDVDNIIKIISSLLTDHINYTLGIELLNKFLCQSKHITEQKLHLWTNQILKFCSTREIETQSIPLFETLTRIATLSLELPDFKKTFTSTYLGKIYECIPKFINVDQIGALHCIETCLKLYPNASIQHRSTIEKFLLRFVDCCNEDVSRCCGKCYHLLQQLQRTSIKNQWQSYQLNLLGSLHKILNQIFNKCSENNRVAHEFNELNLPKINLSEEPVQRTLQLYIRFRNLLIWLIIAISEPFPTEKQIAKSKIIELIARGMSVNRKTLERNSIYDNLVLMNLLPKMHLHLLQLLHILLLALRTHMKANCRSILNILVDSLQWTNSKGIVGEKPFMKLRVKTYNLIIFWCELMQHGSGCELTIDEIIYNIFDDITPAQMGLTLRAIGGNHSKMSKKARRQANKLKNEQSNIMQTYLLDRSSTKQRTFECNNHKLCAVALCCLQQLIKSGSTFFKATLVKVIQDKIFGISSSLNNFSSNSQQMYSHWKCRLELLNTIFALLNTPHHLCPPHLDYALNILQTIYKNDNNEMVRKRVSHIFLMLENIVHPNKTSLSFPIEARDIRNAFIKFGQENLLLNTPFNCVNEDNDEATQNQSEVTRDEEMRDKEMEATQNQSEVTRGEEIRDKEMEATQNQSKVTLDEEMQDKEMEETQNESEATRGEEISDEEMDDVENNSVHQRENEFSTETNIEQIEDLKAPSTISSEAEIEITNVKDNYKSNNKDDDQPSSPKRSKTMSQDGTSTENINEQNNEDTMEPDSLFDDIIADFVDELNSN